jgi:hypothetical protein
MNWNVERIREMMEMVSVRIGGYEVDVGGGDKGDYTYSEVFPIYACVYRTHQLYKVP